MSPLLAHFPGTCILVFSNCLLSRWHTSQTLHDTHALFHDFSGGQLRPNKATRSLADLGKPFLPSAPRREGLVFTSQLPGCG